MPISLRIVLSGFIAIITIICTVVPFVPTYQVGLESVQTTIDDVRGGILKQLLSSVDGFFYAPQQAVSIVQVMQESKQTTFETEPTQSLMNIACQVMMSNPDNSFKTAFFLMPSVTSVTDVGTSTGRYIHCDKRFGPPRAGFLNDTAFFLFHQSIDAPGAQYKYMARGGINTRPYLTIPFTANLLATQPVYQTAEKNSSVRWSNPYGGYNSFQLSAYFSWRESISNTTCIFTLDVLPQAVSDFLSSAGLRKRGRALIAHRGTKYVLGNSWNESNVVLKGKWLDLTAPEPERMLAKKITGYEDPLVNEVITHLGGADSVYALPPQFKDTMDSGKDKVYIDVDTYRDNYGLELLILVAMPEIDFLESVYSTREKIIIIVCVVAVSMVALSIAFAFAMTIPIRRIGDRMYATASLQDDGNDERDNLSFLSEIADIQIAYKLMKQELNRMKAFLPDSVLNAYNDDDDEDEDEGDLGSSHHGKDGNSRATTPSGTPTGSIAAKRSKDHFNDASTSQSRQSSRQFAPGAVAGGLNTRGSLNQKRVAVVAINLSDFHHQIIGALPANVAKIQNTLLRAVIKYVRENRGVVDSFQGDHVVATFNAVNVTQAYCRRATTAAYEICTEVRSNPDMPFARAGVAVGQAFVGNSGIPELQRFNIIGEVYTEAWKCQQICSSKHKKVYSSHATVLVTKNVHVDIDTEFYCQHVDIAKDSRAKSTVLSSVECYADPVKHAKHAARIAAAGGGVVDIDVSVSGKVAKQLHGSPSGDTPAGEEDCEWMYRLDQNSVNDPFRKCNAIFEDLLLPTAPEMDAVQKLIAEVEEADEERAKAASVAKSADGNSLPPALNCDLALTSLREVLDSCDKVTKNVRENHDCFKFL